MIEYHQARQSSPISWNRLRTANWLLWGFVLAACVCALGVLARLAPIAANRFHQDEAIYGYWALKVVTGQDPWLTQAPVDKPPLFIYALALSLALFGPTETAARLPSEVASAASLLLLFALVRRLYDVPTALIALVLLALSPFDILFAPTAFTDPLMVMWVLAALVAAAYGRWGWAGLFLGLGLATKPQAALFLPLVLAVGLFAAPKTPIRSLPAPSPAPAPGGGPCEAQGKPEGSLLFAWGGRWARLLVPLVVVVGLAFLWDGLRANSTGFLRQSIDSYGGWRWAPPQAWADRADQWRALLVYFTGSPLLNACLVVGLPLRLFYDLLGSGDRRRAALDWSLAGFCGLFLLIHTAIDFNIWDRYLLGLMPCLAILLARTLILPFDLIGRLAPRLRPGRAVYGVGIAALCLVVLLRPAQDAASSRFPIGGDHGAYGGFESLVSYFRGQVPGGAVVYHQRLGWHYSFYMYNFPYLFQYYASPGELAGDAVKRPGVPRYVAIPSWQSATQSQWLLSGAGLTMRPVYETFRDDGSRSFTLYRIEEQEPE